MHNIPDIVQPCTYNVRLTTYQPNNNQMKTIHVTHIDTAGHGYLSVSKADLKLLGIDTNVFTRCSGHTLTRMYLEEDQDATFFMNFAQAKGFTVKVKSSYNEKFAITHNYNPELFDYQPAVGDQYNEKTYVVISVDEKRILIRDNRTRMIYKITYHNPFQYIQDVLKA